MSLATNHNFKFQVEKKLFFEWNNEARRTISAEVSILIEGFSTSTNFIVTQLKPSRTLLLALVTLVIFLTVLTETWGKKNAFREQTNIRAAQHKIMTISSWFFFTWIKNTCELCFIKVMVVFALAFLIGTNRIWHFCQTLRFLFAGVEIIVCNGKTFVLILISHSSRQTLADSRFVAHGARNVWAFFMVAALLAKLYEKEFIIILLLLRNSIWNEFFINYKWGKNIPVCVCFFFSLFWILFYLNFKERR